MDKHIDFLSVMVVNFEEKLKFFFLYVQGVKILEHYHRAF